MRLAALLAPTLALTLALPAPCGAAAPTAAETAAAAASALQAAIDSLATARGAENRVEALALTIRAYEAGLAATRGALRQVTAREASLRAGLVAQQARIARLLGVMTTMEADPAATRLLHPEGPVGAARAGMLIADVVPALRQEADYVAAQLQEIGALRLIEERASETLRQGLSAVQAARTDLAQAIAERRDLPQRFTEDPAVMRALLESQDTLDDFAVALAGRQRVIPGEGEFALAKGELPLPVEGRLLRAFREADAAGIRRPGMVLATRARALVSAPIAATIRYRGPLLDYGNVMILEPDGGYLVVLAGLDLVYGEIGQVIPQGTPVGLMGGAEAEAREFLDPAPPSDTPDAGTTPGPDGGAAGGMAGADRRANGEADGGADGGAGETGAPPEETLYIELRQGGEPVNPEEWFAQTRMFP